MWFILLPSFRSVVLVLICFFLMIRRPPRSTRTDTLFPYTTLFRSTLVGNGAYLGPDLTEVYKHAGPAWLAAFLPSAGGWPTEAAVRAQLLDPNQHARSEEHTSELQSLMRNSYAVFCLKKKTKPTQQRKHIQPRNVTVQII